LESSHVGWSIHSNSSGFLQAYNRTSVIYATTDMAPKGPGSQCVLAVVFTQEDRRLIQTGHEFDEMTYDQTLLRGVNQAARWTHNSDRGANRRMVPRIIVYPTRLEELYRQLCDPRTRTFDESYTLHEEIELGSHAWDEGFQPHFLSFEAARNQHGDYPLRAHVASWTNLAEHAALAGHMLYLEDCPDVTHPDQENDQGKILENMYAPGCTSADQARLTTEQEDELRRRTKAPSCIRRGRRPVNSFGGEASKLVPAMFEPLPATHQRDCSCAAQMK
jgi:hypothetical protein